MSEFLSVVMPVQNGLPYLEEALQSILTQTFQDFELVALDDGSTDGTHELLLAWAKRDSRIKVFRSEQSLGLTGSSNEAVRRSHGALVARMDADDRAMPQRLEKQMETFAKHPGAVLVGTLCDGIDARGRKIRPRDRSRLRKRARFSPFPHGSAMFRRAAFDQIGGYRNGCDGWEDRDLFERLSGTGEVFVLPDVLYSYRYSGATSTTRLAALHLNDGEDPASSYGTAAAMAIWAGSRPPRAPRSNGTTARLSDRVRNRFYSTSGTISPTLTRMGMRAWVKARDLSAARTFKDGSEIAWNFERS
jgi:glycosyltransferase involved in cell wall biosynthesis